MSTKAKTMILFFSPFAFFDFWAGLLPAIQPAEPPRQHGRHWETLLDMGAR